MSPSSRHTFPPRKQFSRVLPGTRETKPKLTGFLTERTADQRDRYYMVFACKSSTISQAHSSYTPSSHTKNAPRMLFHPSTYSPHLPAPHPQTSHNSNLSPYHLPQKCINTPQHAPSTPKTKTKTKKDTRFPLLPVSLDTCMIGKTQCNK